MHPKVSDLPDDALISKQDAFALATNYQEKAHYLEGRIRPFGMGRKKLAIPRSSRRSPCRCDFFL